METYLVYVDTASNSNKFWSAKVEGTQLTVEWGRVGYKAQTKVHQLSSQGQAINKYNNLVFEKKAKGYQESQPQIDSNRSISEINRAISLLNNLRSYVENRNFNAVYIQTLNEYLKIIPTPLGMQIDPDRIFRSVGDVDHQRQLLNSLVPATPQAVTQANQVPEYQEKVVSLRGINKNLWRYF